MGNFQKGGNKGGFRGGDRGGDRGGFQKKSWGGGDRDRGPVTMHRATCADCGRSCEVPFRPNGDKPVFCNDCFGGKKEGGDRGDRRDFGSREPRREFNDRPTQSSSFSKPTQGSDDMKRQLSEMNTKIDRLINVLEKFTNTKREAPVIKVIPEAEPVVAAKKTPSLKTVIKKAVEVKSPAKKVVTKKVVAKKTVAKKK
jgi:CxxC-x17-CxxC domain-containing protein